MGDTQTIEVSTDVMFEYVFDQTNPNWNGVSRTRTGKPQPTPEYNLLFIRTIQEYCNTKLQAQGHLFLNEVLVELGFKPTFDGALKGWIVTPDSNDYIDFGTFSTNKNPLEQNRDGSIRLTFVTHGVIANKI